MAFLNSFITSQLFSAQKLGYISQKYSYNFKNAWHATETPFWKKLLNPESYRLFIDFKKKISPEDAYEKMEKSGIRIIPIHSPHYPKLLKKIHNPPFALYVRGNYKTLFPLAMVGSRKATNYGLRAVSSIIEELSAFPVSVISGLAFGIDAHAHTESVRNGLHTVAVLGSGIDHESIYPRFNRGLADKILAGGGGIISEFPPGTKPLAYHFPLRNRIISGLSKATLLYEANIKSGALITAELALEQNRDVFALPGSIFNDASRGPNALLAQGAIPLLSAADILKLYPALKRQVRTVKNNTLLPEEQILYDYIQKNHPDTDALYRCPNLRPSQILSAITTLEIKNNIYCLEGVWQTSGLTNTKDAI